MEQAGAANAPSVQYNLPGDPSIGGLCLDRAKGVSAPVNRVIQLRDGRICISTNHWTQCHDPRNGAKGVAMYPGNDIYQLLDSNIAVACNWDSGDSGSDNRAKKNFQIWSPMSGQALLDKESPKVSNINCVVQLPNGWIAIGVGGQWDSSVHIWDLNAQKGMFDMKDKALVRSLQGHAQSVQCLCVLRDGRLASGGGPACRSVRVWDINAGACQIAYVGHMGAVNGIVQLQDGRLASASDDCRVFVWSMAAPAVELGLNHPAAVSSLVQLASDGALCTGAKDGKVRIWDLRTGGMFVVLDGHKLPVNCVCQLRDGRICSGSSDKTLRVWGSRDAYVSPAPGVLRPADFDPTAPVPQEQCCAIM